MGSGEYFEIDFLAVESKKSGDAITMRYSYKGSEYIHVVDGGFTDTGQKVLDHIKKHYPSQGYIDNVVVTHSDADHVLGLKTVLEDGDVKALWMNRPWLYAGELVRRFKTYNSETALYHELRRAYDYIVDLEEIADRKGIPIYAPFQGEHIGRFTVMTPTKSRYLDLIVESDRTLESITEDASIFETMLATFSSTVKAAANLVSAAWNEEYFPTAKTNRENEMSVVQYAEIDGVKILLTGDSGREGLQEFIDYAPYVGL